MTFPILILLLAISVFGCGDPTDESTDCNTNEYFDESDQRCRTCPPLAEPECAEGCGFTIQSDSEVDTIDRCPEAVCNLSCDLPVCSDGEYFSDEALGCVACPAAPATPATCEDLGCTCELVTLDSACSSTVCRNCTDPQAGWSVDAVGACVMAP